MFTAAWNWFLDQVSTNPSTWSWQKILVVVASTAVLLSGAVKAVCAAAESVLGTLDKLKKRGLGARWSKERKQDLLRRRQFCTMIASDLATLAKSENWNDHYFADLEA